jgi:DNA-binding IclR family transcriptional regulator
MGTVDQVGVTELAEEVGVDKSTVHSHLNTLRRNNLVVKTGTKYRLSLEFIALSEHVKDQIGPYDIITEEVDELAAETGEVAQFATEEQEQVVYVYKSEGEKPCGSSPLPATGPDSTTRHSGRRSWPTCATSGSRTSSSRVN